MLFEHLFEVTLNWYQEQSFKKERREEVSALEILLWL